MCRVGVFNQSHASLTSPEALSALRKLATENPILYNEFTANIHSTTGEGVEPDYFTEPDDIGVVDESDTPVDVAIEHVLAESAGAPHGFVVRDDGALARSGNVEPPVNVPEPILGRGHRKKKVSERYGLELHLWKSK